MDRNRFLAIFACIQCIFFLPGCKIVDWGVNNFNQAEKLTEDFSVPMNPYIKTSIIYDQFATVAEFTALFLTDHARVIYLDYFFHRNFRTEDEKEITKHRLMQENEYFITFYVVGNQPSTLYPSGRSMFSGEYHPQGPFLGGNDAVWKPTMIVDGQEYAADDVKSVELPIEYQYFFGVNYSQFKSVYRIRFDARNQEDKNILSKAQRNVVLKFSSVNYETRLSWPEMSYRL